MDLSGGKDATTADGPVPIAETEKEIHMDNVNENTTTIVNPATDMDVIEAAIAAAKTKSTGKKRGAPVKLTAEEKAQRLADRTAAKDARRLAREQRKAERLAAKALRTTTPHLKKIERAQAALPVLSEAAQSAFNGATESLNPLELTALSGHLAHFVRVQRTLNAVRGSARLSPGESVRIVGGDPRYVGLEGKVVKAQRIRCYVEVPGKSKPVYLFTSDCEAIA